MIKQDTFQEYLEHVGLNQTTAKTGLKSAKSMRYAIDNPRGETSGMRIGSGVHSLIECMRPGGQSFGDLFGVMPPLHLAERGNVDVHGYPTDSKNSKHYRAARDQWLTENKHRVVLSADEYQAAANTLDAILAENECRRLLAACTHFELSVYTHWRRLPVKGRLDLWCDDGVLCDVKTTQNVEKYAFGRIFVNQNYGFQLAWYRRLLETCGKRVNEVWLITAEQSPPHDCAAVPIPREVLDNADDQVNRVLRLYEACSRNDYWPGVANGQPYELVVPNWAMQGDDEVDWAELPGAAVCPHGNAPADCDACMRESDFQFDAARERAHFPR